MPGFSRCSDQGVFGTLNARLLLLQNTRHIRTARALCARDNIYEYQPAVSQRTALRVYSRPVMVLFRTDKAQASGAPLPAVAAEECRSLSGLLGFPYAILILRNLPNDYLDARLFGSIANRCRL